MPTVDHVSLVRQAVDIFRMKGVLNIRGMKSRFVFQAIHMLFSGMPDRPWLPGKPLPSFAAK